MASVDSAARLTDKGDVTEGPDFRQIEWYRGAYGFFYSFVSSFLGTRLFFYFIFGKGAFDHEHLHQLPARLERGSRLLQEVFSVVRRYGRTAAVVGGKTALSKAYDAGRQPVAGTGLTLTQPIWYGGNSTV